MSVADDGGSSGRLRRDLGVLAAGRPPPVPGRARRRATPCGRDAFEHRFGGGELDGHALGNLVLVGLTETLGDFSAALDEAGPAPRRGRAGAARDDRAGRAEGRRRAASAVEGQVAVAEQRRAHPPGRARARRRAAPAEAVAAIARRRPGRARAGIALHERARRCCASADLRDAVAAAPGRGGAGGEPAAPAARDRRARRRRPPAGGPGPRRPGRRASSTSGTAASPSTTPRSGRSGSTRCRPTSRGPTGWRTIRTDWRRRSRLCCSPPARRSTWLPSRDDGGTSMTVRVGINGFGRIGRSFTRALLARGERRRRRAGRGQRPDGRQRRRWRSCSSTTRSGGTLRQRGQGSRRRLLDRRPEIKKLEVMDPAEIPWGDHGVDVVIESTGLFTAREKAAGHLERRRQAGDHLRAERRRRRTICMGVNDAVYDPAQHTVISNASCTTNCLAPMAKVLNDRFGIEQGLMTTVHAYTSDQSLQDLAKATPQRQARPAPHARRRAVDHPEQHRRGEGHRPRAARAQGQARRHVAARARRPTGSITDLTADARPRGDASTRSTTRSPRPRHDPSYRGVLEYTDEPLVSADIVGNPASCIFSARTRWRTASMVKVLGWYDNEWGYSNRLVDLVAFVGAVARRRSATPAPRGPPARAAGSGSSCASTSTCRCDDGVDRPTTCASPPRCRRSSGCASTDAVVVVVRPPRPAEGRVGPAVLDGAGRGAPRRAARTRGAARAARSSAPRVEPIVAQPRARRRRDAREPALRAGRDDERPRVRDEPRASSATST